MAHWITSIVGVICLGILLEIVLPDGKTAKYVRGAFSILVILVIVAPLPSLFKKDWTPQPQGTFEVDDEYVNLTYSSYCAKLSEGLENYLEANGCAAEVKLVLDDGMSFAIAAVNITTDAPEDKVVELVKNRLNVSEDIIYIFQKTS